MNWNLNNWLTIISAVISVVSVYYAYKANQKSDEANEIANKANKLVEEANEMSNNANEIARRTGYTEYYNHLHNINRNLIKIVDSLTINYNVMMAEDLIKRLCSKLSEITNRDQIIAFPNGTNEVFNEINDGCKIIDQRVTELKNMVVSLNEDTNNNVYLGYEIENLSEESKEKYNDKVNIIEDSIFKLTNYIDWARKQY